MRGCGSDGPGAERHRAAVFDRARLGELRCTLFDRSGATVTARVGGHAVVQHVTLLLRLKYTVQKCLQLSSSV